MGIRLAKTIETFNDTNYGEILSIKKKSNGAYYIVDLNGDGDASFEIRSSFALENVRFFAGFIIRGKLSDKGYYGMVKHAKKIDEDQHFFTYKGIPVMTATILGLNSGHLVAKGIK